MQCEVVGRGLCFVLMYIVGCSVFLWSEVCDVVVQVVGWGFGACVDVWTGVFLGVSFMVSCFLSWCALKCRARWCGF